MIKISQFSLTSTTILFSLFFVACSNPNDRLNSSTPVEELKDSLKIAKEFLLKLETEDIKNFYWDDSNSLFITGKKIGSFNNEKKFNTIRDLETNQKRFIEVIIYLRAENIFSGFVENNTGLVAFDYSYEGDMSPDNVRLLILSNTEADLKNIKTGYEVVNKYGALYLVRFNEKFLNFNGKM